MEHRWQLYTDASTLMNELWKRKRVLFGVWGAYCPSQATTFYNSKGMMAKSFYD